jgi:hypothetical protein
VDLGAGGLREDLSLFGEGPSRAVLSVKAERVRHFERLMGEFQVAWRWIGRVGGDRLVISRDGAGLVDLDLDRVGRAWREGFERYVS